MDVTSWLATRFGLVRRAEVTAKIFEIQELTKVMVAARTELREMKESHGLLVDRFTTANDDCVNLEASLAQAEEAKVLAVAQLETLKNEVGYLKQQVTIYQRRLGLLPPEKSGETENKALTPLRAAREPFAIAAARIEANRTEAYWKQRAANVNVDGVTGTTSTDSPTVSDKDPA